ncbi:hypothetical protein LTR10_015373 [Elasticomyces elasticus]|uniref:Nephrocystin 3-like N-terminal domain-containing protein n=1 Tax=Exophiala sideris TaxID=1016849 RepID=A0ABR0JJ74_9EURO|nr:hypothetical protein LTR10_015373 [Elasticomyces elasticus]KAK5030227.1 hypothetical protein LTR13_008245 [Exophiala sideris]KAK5035117.1 hypothetical protein LTS07_002553 [Exophiala sideris]KAK5066040.1 hypothetical protein LTR69_002558 [Exophiala sideris]KAK5178292.1 hypothetical protein LTR44_009167 [Eurotiomycetes sp. CCFEE 6388]
MAFPQRPQSRHDFEIALVCALQKEADAVLSLFDGHWRDHGGEFTKPEGSTNIYWTGWIGSHNVVLVQLPGMGITNAAGVAGGVLPCFPRIRLSLVVGICGGVPGRTEKEMILGDVVISTRIVQLGPASRYPDALIKKDTYEYQVGRHNPEILAFLMQVQGNEGLNRLQDGLEKYVHKLREKEPEKYEDPGVDNDQLYAAGYRHKHQRRTECDICSRCERYEDPVCETARKSTCSQLGCDPSKLVNRKRLQTMTPTTNGVGGRLEKRVRLDNAAPSPEPLIHFGPVGSGDWVFKSQIHRDSINTEVIAYEMEGLGVSHNLPSLVIKGVCDYADSHKNKDWQNYAAATAAACMKAILDAWPKVDTTSVSHPLKDQEEEKEAQKEKERLQKQQEWYLKSLRFDQLDTRHGTIRPALAETCRWLLEKPEYQSWLAAEKQSQHQLLSFFWIKGKPGAGKSTIMKFSLANIKHHTPNTVTISFFFHARGNSLERTTLGMYRSLLSQLFESIPSLKVVLNSLPPQPQPPKVDLEQPTKADPKVFEWELEDIQNLFERAIVKIDQQSLICFIDALDECEEDQIRDMMEFFEHLGALAGATRFRTCFSSRHYPHITITNATQLVLEDQAEHHHDLGNYLEGRLNAKSSELIDEIKAEMLEKACGIFLWVVLVVQILNKEYDHGRTHAMRKRLSEIPRGLDELFTDILSRGTQSMESMDETATCLQWLLFARRPLKPEELYFAILAGTEPSSVNLWDHTEIDQGTIWRFILSSSKGLAEVTTARTVQFIHESVRDYLKGNGRQKLRPDSTSNFEGLSHEQLRDCCRNYTEIAIPHLSSIRGAGTLSTVRSFQSVDANLPFLQYAIRNMLYHADAAAEAKMNQLQFFDKFPRAAWILLRNLLEEDKSRHYSPTISLLCIFASENVAHLVRIERDRVENIDVPGDRCCNPLIAAMNNGNKEALKALLAPSGSLRPSMDILQNQQTSLSNEEREATIIHLSHRGVGDSLQRSVGVNYQTLLSWAAWSNEIDVVRILLATNKVNVNPRDHFGRTPLTLAASHGYDAVVKVILTSGRANIEAQADGKRTPLWLAACFGHMPVVKLLLAAGRVNADAQDRCLQTPLSSAAGGGHHAVVQLLLATDRVDVDAPDGRSRTPLAWPAYGGHEAVVRLLLATGRVDVNARDYARWTPLSLAAARGHETVVKLLLAPDLIDMDAINEVGQTSLSLAARSGRYAVVKLLLATGRVDVDKQDDECRTPLSWAA